MSAREHLQYRHEVPTSELTDLSQKECVALHLKQHNNSITVETPHVFEDLSWTAADVEAAKDRLLDSIEADRRTRPTPGTYASRVQSALAQSDASAHGPHGEHYAAMAIQPIDVIEAWDLGFNLGSALKYLARPKGQPVEDLEKAIWYLQRELTSRRGAGRPASNHFTQGTA